MSADRPTPTTAKAVILLALAGLFAYYNSLHGQFVFDDMRFVVDPKIGRPFQSSMAARPVRMRGRARPDSPGGITSQPSR